MTLTKSAVVLLTLILVSCTSSSSKRAEEANVWIGQPIQKVIDDWGPPDSQVNIEGKNYYSWVRRSSFKTNERIRADGRISGGQVFNKCRKTSMVVEGGVVTDWRIDEC